MAFLGDYHTHTIHSRRKGWPFLHAKGTIEDNVQAASDLGLKEIAITDHGFNHRVFCTYIKNYPKFRAEIEELKKKYNINILLGVEANLIGRNGEIDVKPQDKPLLDIILCGYHVNVRPNSLRDKFGLFYYNYILSLFGLKKGRIRRNTQSYIKMLENNDIDILVHMNAGMFLVDAVEVAKAAVKKGTLIELNNRHMNFTKEEIDKMAELGVKFIANSDAHRPGNVANFAKIRAKIAEYNIPKENIVNWDNLPEFINYKRGK